MIFLKLFAIFFRIGLFGFGGGLAMLPLIFQSVQEFGDVYGILGSGGAFPGDSRTDGGECGDICGVQLCGITGSLSIDDRRMSSGFRNDDDSVRIHRQIQGQQIR